jgi:hypothetical protein
LRYAIGITLLAIILFVGIPLAWWQFRVETSDIKGRGEVTMTVNSSGNRITEYRTFFDLCVAVQNAETTIDNETARLEVETIPKERSHILANISAAQTARARSINEYNANSDKYTSEQFQDSDLPHKLSTAPYTAGGQHTSCHV